MKIIHRKQPDWLEFFIGAGLFIMLPALVVWFFVVVF